MTEDIYFVKNETVTILAFSCEYALVGKPLNWDFINLFSSTGHWANLIPTSCFSMLNKKNFEA